MAIGGDLGEQYRRVFESWGEAIAGCLEGEWRRGEYFHLTPARAALHAIETVEFYAADGPDSFHWGHRFAVDWERVEAAGLLSQADVGAYATDWRAGSVSGSTG